MSFIARPERSKAVATAGTGPSPMRDGSTPALAQVTSRTRGVSPSSAARSGVVTMQTAAASFWPLALPAVTVAAESLAASTGFSAASASRVLSGRGVSSASTTVEPVREVTVTGTISSKNQPSATATPARCCDRSARASWSSRLIE